MEANNHARSIKSATRLPHSSSRQLVIVASLIACLSLSACPTSISNKKQPVASQDKAAAIRVAPTMVVPWKDIQSVLQPNFTMNGDTAVSEVLPVTSRSQSEFLDALGAGLAIGLPQISRQGSSTSTSNSANNSSTASGVTTITSSSGNGTSTTSTTATAPGVAPALPTGVPAATSALSAASNTGALGVDLVQKYKAANYLNEAVQLLNKEVQYAAARGCYVPYVVKLKIAVMTYHQDLPFSVHSRVSFFDSNTERYKKDDEAWADRAETPLKSIPTDFEDSIDKCNARTLSQPVVVPLLAADDVNIALKSGTSEVARQLGLALSFMEYGVGGSGSLNSLRQGIRAISDQDMSSNLTVTQETQNTLYVRIAPNNEGQDPSLQNQTYDIAVLVLIPQGYFHRGHLSCIPERDGRTPVSIEVATYSQLRNAVTGEVLPGQPPDTFLHDFEQFIAPHLLMTGARAKTDAWAGASNDEKFRLLSALAGPVQISSYASLVDALRTWGPDSYCSDGTKNQLWGKEMPANRQAKDQGREPACGDTELPASDSSTKRKCDFLDVGESLSIWVGISSILSNWPLVDVDFEVPPPSDVTVPLPQDALVLDDGKQTAQVQLRNVIGDSSASLSAYLSLAQSGPGGSHRPPANLAAQSLSLDPATHVLTLAFASPKKWGLTTVPSPPGRTGKNQTTEPSVNATLVMSVACRGDRDVCPRLNGSEKDSLTLPARIVTSSDSDQGPPAFRLVQGSTVIDESTDGKGILSVALSGLPAATTVGVTIAGADISNAADSGGAALSIGDSGYVLAKNGIYVFNLFNLSPNAKITLTAQGLTKQQGKTPQKSGATTSLVYSVVGLVAQERR